MSNATLKATRDAFCDIILASLDGNAPYTTYLNPANIHRFYSQSIFQTDEDVTFPRTMLMIDSGVREPMPSGGREDKTTFYLMFQCKRQTSLPEELEDVKLAFIEDLTAAVNANDTLGGLVQDVSLPQFVTDNGASDPIGIVLFEVEVLELGR